MKRRRVVVSPGARADLKQLHRWIAGRGAPKTATAYVNRIRAFARSLETAAERGRNLSEIRNGLRAIAFERVVLAVRIDDTTVIVLRVFGGSQDWLGHLRDAAERNQLGD